MALFESNSEWRLEFCHFCHKLLNGRANSGLLLTNRPKLQRLPFLIKQSPS